MKKFIMILTLAVFSISCSKDDKNEASIIGQWNYSKVDNTDDGIENFVDYVQNDASCSKDNYTFNASGNYEDISYISDNNPCEPYLDAGTWTKTETGIHFISEVFGVFDVQILELTSSELKLKWDNGVTVIFERE